VLSRGDYTVFVTRPMSLVMLLMAFGLLALMVVPAIRKRRETVFQES
jgi:putative tricarboxylic transport membrane protein